MDKDLVAFIDELETPFLNESFGTERSFSIETGNNPVMLSAPHSVTQWRLNAIKQGEYRSGTIARVLHSATRCHIIYKTRNDRDDANFDHENPYRTEAVQYIKDHHVEYFIDLHIMSSSRPHDIDFGTGRGANINGNYGLVARFADIFSENGVSHLGVDKVFTAANSRTVSATVAKHAGIFAIQIEMNWRLLDTSRGTGDFLRVVKSLERIVDFLNKGWE